MRILVAEDDAPLAEFLHQRLVQEQFSVQVVSSGPEAQQLASEQSYDLVLLDLNLPGGGGLDVLRGIRSKRPDLPVVIVTGASMVEERVRGLDAGADDYVAKPFAFAELAARIRAVLRRGSRPARSILQIDDLEVDRVSHTVRRGSHNIDLSPKEFALLEYLMRHEGQPVSRTAIVEQVWKLNFDTVTNVVDVYINYLRRKVDSGYDRALIRTIRGVGYQIGGNGQHPYAEGHEVEAFARSFSVGRVFPSPIGEVNLPDLVAGKIEHSKLDIPREFKEEVTTFSVQLGMGHSLVSKMILQFLYRINWCR